MFLEEINKKYEESLENNKLLTNELEETKNKLKKYTAPARNKRYYEAHKEEAAERKRLRKEQKKSS